MKGKSLLLVVRPESLEDFRSIAKKIRKIDPYIDVLIFSVSVNSDQIPSHFLKQPLLAIYLVEPPPEDFENSFPMLVVKKMNKYEEYVHFKKHNLPSLPIEPFYLGMTLDPLIYGEYVVLKPQNMQSTGKDVNMVPTKLISTLKISDFPEGHLIHNDDYYVQKFLRTSYKPVHHRVTVFIDEVILSSKTILNSDYPPPSESLKDRLKKTIAANDTANRQVWLFKDESINQFALDVAKTFPKNVLFGLDILKEEETGKLYILETNIGGNVWHFSSDAGKVYRNDLGGRKPLITQYNALDRVAETIVRKMDEIN